VNESNNKDIGTRSEKYDWPMAGDRFRSGNISMTTTRRPQMIQKELLSSHAPVDSIKRIRGLSDNHVAENATSKPCQLAIGHRLKLPRTILREVQKMDPISFERLTEQVIGWWIDSEAKSRGVSKWSALVLARVAKGNSPGGKSTRTGVLGVLTSVFYVLTATDKTHSTGAIPRSS